MRNLFLNFDLSNAENRIVLALTRDAEMLRLARSAPWELDMHTENAAAIFGKPAADVTKEERQLGKVISHGAQRGMRGATLSERILKATGVFMSNEQCERYIDTYIARYAPLADYFKDVRMCVLRHRALCNTWGRIIRFDYDNLSEGNVFFEAYSFLPQSECGDLLNQWGFLPLYGAMMRAYGRPPNLQLHDSVLASIPPNDIWDVMQFVRRNLGRPRVYYGEALTIPINFSIGRTWAMDVEFDRPPTRSEVEAAVRGLA